MKQHPCLQTVLNAGLFLLATAQEPCNNNNNNKESHSHHGRSDIRDLSGLVLIPPGSVPFFPYGMKLELSRNGTGAEPDSARLPTSLKEINTFKFIPAVGPNHQGLPPPSNCIYTAWGKGAEGRDSGCNQADINVQYRLTLD